MKNWKRVALCGSWLAFAAPALAENYELPRGSLVLALKQLERDAGMQIVYRPDQLSGVMTAGASAKTSETALTQALRGTGFTARRDASGGIAIVQQAVRPRRVGLQASPSGVAAPAEPGPEPEISGGAVVDIVVTAQRKSERLQEVPIAVNVVSGPALSTSGVVSTMNLQTLVPGLDVAMQGGSALPFLRGVGSTASAPNIEPSVATYVDGVYVASPFGFASSLSDVERVEVLKGPQGTLFGRNATGGVIQIITRDPSHTPELGVSMGYANYGTISGSLYATTGLTEKVAVAFTAQGSDQRNGWGYNATRGQDAYRTKDWVVRGKTLIEPTDNLRFVLSGDYQYVSSNTVDYRQRPGVRGIDGQTAPADKYDTRGTVTLRNLGEPKVVNRQYGVSLNTSLDLDFAQLVSITAYRKDRGTVQQDADGTPQPWVDAQLFAYQHNISQELQLLSNRGSRLDWTLGLYYYNADAGYHSATFGGLAFARPVGSAYGMSVIVPKQHSESKSAYAQTTYEVLDDTKLTVGLRYTDERQHQRATANGVAVPEHRRKFERVTWRAALDHAFTSDIHAYVSYNRGIKSGGFDLLSPATSGFSPETLDAVEVGLKSKLLDNKLRFNAAYFYYDYRNIQVLVVPAGTAGIVQTTNAGKARIQGLDVDFELRPVRDFGISGGFAYISSKYLDFRNTVSYQASPLSGGSSLIDASGNRTVRTPRFTGNLTAQYRIRSSIGDFPVSVTASHNSGYFFTADNRLRQPSYTLINARIEWQPDGDHYSVALWGNNLGNAYYLAQGVASAFGDLVSPMPPRTYGITLKAKLGG